MCLLVHCSLNGGSLSKFNSYKYITSLTCRLCFLIARLAAISCYICIVFSWFVQDTSNHVVYTKPPLPEFSGMLFTKA